VVASTPPPCLISHLRLTAQNPRLGVFYDGETGSLAGWITFRNTGATCALTGRPRLQILRGSAPVRERVAVLPGEGPSSTTPRPSYSPAALPPGRTATVEGVWSNWCGRAPPTGVRVTVPSGGSVVLRLKLRPRCDAPGEPTSVAVGPFQALGPP
jgi:hypothetical protein